MMPSGSWRTESGRPSGTRLLLVAVPLLASLALSARFIAARTFRVDGALVFLLFDDAMISMRYARNLVEGHGLVWNPGGPPVEGYTNFLWTLWMAVLHLPRLSDGVTPLVVSASGAVLLVLNALAIGAAARRVAPDAFPVPEVTLWLSATCLALAYWTLVGLEVGLIALLASLAMLLALRWLSGRREADLTTRTAWPACVRT